MQRKWPSLLGTGMLLLATARAEAATVAREEDGAAVEQTLTEIFEQGYDALLGKAGNPLTRRSSEFQPVLQRAVKAVMSVRPDGCTPERLASDVCGLRSYSVASSSMSPTLREREVFMLVPLGAAPPRRSDVIAFKEAGQGTVHVFRVIGLPGERVELRRGVVLVDSVPLARDSVAGTITDVEGRSLSVLLETDRDGHRYRIARFGATATAAMDDMAPVTVPPKAYFVLGDNRQNAADSRYPDLLPGRFVPAASVLGRAAVIFASPDTNRIGIKIE